MIRRLYIWCLYVCVVILLFGRGLGYAPWKDDWNYFWLIMHPLKYPMVSWLHPGTMLQFYLTAVLVGNHYMSLQVFGLLLKAGAALGVMDLGVALFGTVPVGVLSGLVFAAIPLGLEAVNWPSAYIVHADIWLYGSVLGVIIGAVRSGKRIPVPVRAGAVLMFLLDPLRAVALVWVPLYFLRGYFGPILRRSPRATVFWGSCAVVYAGLAFYPAYTLWYRHMFSPVAVSVISGCVRILTVIGNLFVGWFIRLPHTVGDLNRSVPGFAMPLVGLGAVVGFAAYMNVRMRKRVDVRPLAFVGVWIVSFVVIQWISEPGYIPAVIHRHMALPGVGISLLLGLMLAKISKPVLYGVLVLYFVAVWRIGDDAFLSMDMYRPTVTVERNMKLLEDTLIKRTVPPVIFFENTQNPLADAGDYRDHLTYLRATRGDPERVAVYTNISGVRDLICRQSGFGTAYAVSDIYAFEFGSKGNLTDESDRIRGLLRADATVRSRCMNAGMADGL